MLAKLAFASANSSRLLRTQKMQPMTRFRDFTVNSSARILLGI
jgi:hypothetical protein